MYVLIEQEETIDGANIKLVGTYNRYEEAYEAMCDAYEENRDDDVWGGGDRDDMFAYLYDPDMHLSSCVRWVIFDSDNPKTAWFE